MWFIDSSGVVMVWNTCSIAYVMNPKSCAWSGIDLLQVYICSAPDAAPIIILLSIITIIRINNDVLKARDFAALK